MSELDSSRRGPLVTTEDAQQSLGKLLASSGDKNAVASVEQYIAQLTEQRDAAVREVSTLQGEKRRLQLTRDERLIVAEYMAKLDLDTGLFNKKTFEEEIVKGFVYSICRDRRDPELHEVTDEMAALWVADLKGLGQVNNLVSHEAGDLIILRLAHLLKTEIRQRDQPLIKELGALQVPGNFGRWGGDEFGVLQPKVRRFNDAYVAASRIRDLYKESNWGEWHDAVVKMYPDIRVGIACLRLNSIRPLKGWTNKQARAWADESAGHIAKKWLVAADTAMRYVKNQRLSHNFGIVVEYNRKKKRIVQIPDPDKGSGMVEMLLA